MRLYGLGILTAAMLAGTLGTASAGPLSISGSAIERSETGIVSQVQYRQRNVVRSQRYGGGYRGGYRGGGYRRGGGGAGGLAAAGLALGVLGAIAATEASRSSCWVENRRTYDRYGYYVGVRRTRVCN